VRLFVAVYPPPEALDHLAGAVGRLRLGEIAAAGTNVRIVARPLWHLTLAFLGEVDSDRAPDAAAAVATGVDRWRRGGAAASALRLSGGGRFGRRRFTVLWVGLAGDLAGIRSLAEAVRRELRRARLPFDRKPFRPHLTLARPGDRLGADDLATDLETMRGYEGPEWTVESVCLVRSQVGPEPVHEAITIVPL
jgi:2'-5' RNA ligase